MTAAPKLTTLDDNGHLGRESPGAAGGPCENFTDAQRLDILRELLGRRDDDVEAFPQAIRAVVRGNFDRYVRPLFAAHWPAGLEGATGKKLTFLSCDLYATAPYTVLFCAEHPPAVVAVATKISQFIRLSPRSLARVSAFAVRTMARSLDEKRQRRISVIACFIATIDHVFDHCMTSVPPPLRAERMKALLDGSWTPPEGADRGPLLAVKALKDAMVEDVAPEDQAAIDRAVHMVEQFLDSEVKGMTGVPDPSGLCWRAAGIEGTIDGLIAPVHRYAGESVRQWMVSVSLFVQVMDDWIDAEKDRDDVRATPVITGVWTLQTLRDAFEDTVLGLEELARNADLDERFVSFVRSTYVTMSHEVMEAMCRGSAA